MMSGQGQQSTTAGQFQQPSTPTVPTQPQGGGWQGFQFQNPTSGYQQNYNALAKINPAMAMAYTASGYGGPDAWNQFRNAYGQGAGALYNQFAGSMPGVIPGTQQAFNPADYGNLLVTTPEIQKQTDPMAFYQSTGTNPFSMAPSPSNDIMGADWYRAAMGLGKG